MPKLWINNLEDVSEGLRDEYEKVGTRYKLKGDDFDGIDDPQGMKTALGAANSEAGKRRKAIEAWEKLGKTPEEIADLIDKEVNKERENLEKKGEWEKLRDQMNQQHQTALQAEKARADALEQEINGGIIENDALRALGEHKGSTKVLLPHVLSRVKVGVDETTGKRFSQVVTEDGKTPRVTSEGKPFTVSNLVAEMKKDPEFSRSFEGTTGSGGGASDGNGGKGGTPSADTKRSTMSVAQKAKYVEEHGQEAYLQLPQ